MPIIMSSCSRSAYFSSTCMVQESTRQLLDIAKGSGRGSSTAQGSSQGPTAMSRGIAVGRVRVPTLTRECRTTPGQASAQGVKVYLESPLSR